jgi:hypothetical protein
MGWRGMICIMYGYGDEYMDDCESGERKICSIINQRVCYLPNEGECFDKGENALILM